MNGNGWIRIRETALEEVVDLVGAACAVPHSAKVVPTFQGKCHIFL